MIGMVILYRHIGRMSIVFSPFVAILGGFNKMQTENLYNSPFVANRIKEYAKLKNIPLKDILSACGLGSNTFSHMLHGKSLAFNSLALIADYLDCSVDYLLGRTDVVEINKKQTTFADYLDIVALGGKETRPARITEIETT